jgi:hypothetical protein
MIELRATIFAISVLALSAAFPPPCGKCQHRDVSENYRGVNDEKFCNHCSYLPLAIQQDGNGILLGSPFSRTWCKVFDMFVYSRTKTGRVELLGEIDIRNPNLAVEAVTGKIIVELLAMNADTGELLAYLRECELIATDGDSLESASPYRPEK